MYGMVYTPSVEYGSIFVNWEDFNFFNWLIMIPVKNDRLNDMSNWIQKSYLLIILLILRGFLHVRSFFWVLAFLPHRGYVLYFWVLGACYLVIDWLKNLRIFDLIVSYSGL